MQNIENNTLLNACLPCGHIFWLLFHSFHLRINGHLNCLPHALSKLCNLDGPDCRVWSFSPRSLVRKSCKISGQGSKNDLGAAWGRPKGSSCPKFRISTLKDFFLFKEIFAIGRKKKEIQNKRKYGGNFKKLKKI